MATRRLSLLVLLSGALSVSAADKKPASPPPKRVGNTAIEAAPREGRWLERHADFVDEAKRGGIDVLFLGDSITDFWRTEGRAVWEKEFGGLRAANLGISGDRTQHVLWRLRNGEGEGFQPKLIVLMIGTNNTGLERDGKTPRNTVPEVVAGVTAVVKELRGRFASSQLLLLGIFPRSERDSAPRAQIAKINKAILKLDDRRAVHFLDIGDHFKDAQGEIPKELMPDLLHPSLKGYELWADAIREPLARLWPEMAAAKQAGLRARRVEIGLCAALKDLEAAKAAGFDYAELRTSEVAALSDDDFEALLTRLKGLKLAVPVTYTFIPPEIKLTGPKVDEARQNTYVRKALDRAARLGAGIVVFGSGPARSYPEGFSKDEAMRQLVGFGKRVAPLARARGITLAVEPQRIQESNLVNNAAEGLELVAAVADPNFDLMLDYYQLEEAKDDPGVILRAPEHVRHLHMANPVKRVFPLRDEEYDYKAFFANLRSIGYRGRISVEGSTQDFGAEAPRTIAFLRGLFEAK